MKMLQKWIMMVFLFALSNGAMADTLKDTAEARQLADRVMSQIGAGNTEAGILLAKPFMIIPVAELDVWLDQIKMQQPALAQRFGKSLGHEFIREDKVGQHLVRIIYIHRYEKHLMRWSFYFYRGAAGWVLNTFKTDDHVFELFPH